jgi:immune inhibitor A
MLVWAVDETYTDNNTSEHEGHGLVLPIDARPAPITYSDGVPLGNRRQPFDATFGLWPTDDFTFHREVLTGKGKAQAVTVVTAEAPSSPGIPTFTDADPDAYWSDLNPWNSALVAGSGVTITVTADSVTTMTISVSNPAVTP